ncbi:MAG: MFS transporter, partial [SAR202 cluster bacterium]|nr:MFS transporter [SAR202 cluster bacterium]
PPRASASDERSWTRREALRSWAFWRLTLAFGLHMMAQQSVSLYRFPHYEDQGIAPSIVSFAASMEGVASIAGALLVGPLIARHGTQRVTSLGFICMAVSHILTITTTSVAHVVAAIAVFGLGVSFLVMGQNLLYPLFFGRRHIGAIRGIGLSFTLAVAGLSGPATGFIADRTGSFNYIWWPMVTILVVSSALIFTAKAPTYRDAGAAPERAQAG